MIVKKNLYGVSEAGNGRREFAAIAIVEDVELDVKVLASSVVLVPCDICKADALCVGADKGPHVATMIGRCPFAHRVIWGHSSDSINIALLCRHNQVHRIATPK